MAVKIPVSRIIVIIGPTASGKSNLGIKIAKKFSGEIISADSRQVYRGMDIGTGKVLSCKTLPVPNSKFKNQNVKLKNGGFYSEGIRHYLIDVADPKKQFTASDFKKQGGKAIKEILAKGKIPIIVGGTGFYIDVLLDRMTVAEVPPNPKLRKHLDRLATEHLFKMLQKLDPQQAKIIDRHNKRRLIRALEIASYFGKENLKNLKPEPRVTSHHDRVNMLFNYLDILYIGIKVDKEKLAKNIKTRLSKRLSQGMIREVKKLHTQGVSWKRLDNFGLEYRWVSRWIRKATFHAPYSTFKNSEEYQKLLRDIIRYSKRQMTWFKRNKEIYWLENKREANRLLVRFLDG